MSRHTIILRGSADRAPSNNYRHGHRSGEGISPEYRSWRGMRARCHDPKNRSYPRYGGRGIKVCERWNNSFLAFLEDMGPCPSAHTLDRIDNDGNYEPTNCRWATRSEQASNRNSTRVLEYNGVSKTCSEWAAHFGVSKSVIHSRLKAGWPIPDVLSPPQRKRAK